jgi:predicted negative regulator of RcsB-dependent stress response
MAKALDLDEQEQLDQIKHFWRTWGNLISWILIALLGSYAAWNGYQYWQRSQATKAAALFDEVERAVASGEGVRIERSLSDMKAKYGSTQFAQQAAFLAAKSLQTQGKTDEAIKALQGVADSASDKGYRDIARLRLAGLHLDAKAYDPSLQQLSADFTPAMAGLAADLRGDVLQAKGQSAEAIAAYKTAWTQLADSPEYRRLVQAKLNALGVDPLPMTSTGTAK